MNLDELQERLKGFEWNDVEFKAAQTNVPKNAYETVSAFSNTAGGWLVFGVDEKDGGQFEIVGVIAVDKVQNEFLTTLRTREKFNRIIETTESHLSHEDKTLLIFYIPEVHRREKPVYLNGDIRKTYIRSGGGDMHCSEVEINRFLREASDERYDSGTVVLDPATCFEADSLRWYRSLFNARNPGRDPSIPDLEFLQDWGLVLDQEGRLLPTRASILLFGTQRALAQLLPRPVVDCQYIQARFQDELPEERWADRLVVENNLMQAWRSLVDFYTRHAEHPFQIDPATLQRQDLPPDYLVFREAAINLLIHQDYAEAGRTGLIRFFRDQTIFANPGDAFIPSDELLDPGDKELRNPKIANAFRRIGLSEAAGTGVTSIFRSWRQMGLVPPIINNDRSKKIFELTLPKEALVSETQLLFEAGLGVHLTEQEALVFAYACRQGRLRMVDIKAVTGLATDRARDVANRLVMQGLLVLVDALPAPYYQLAEHLRAMTEPAAQNGASPILHELSATQWKVIEVADTPRTLSQLMSLAGIKRTERDDFEQNVLQPLMQGHIIQLTRPDEAESRRYYILTEIGKKLRQRHLSRMAG